MLPDIVWQILRIAGGGIVGGVVGFLGYILTRGLHDAYRMWIVDRSMDRNLRKLTDAHDSHAATIRELHDILERADSICLPGVPSEHIPDLPAQTVILHMHEGHAHTATKGWDVWYMSNADGTRLETYTDVEMMALCADDSAFLAYRPVTEQYDTKTLAVEDPR